MPERLRTEVGSIPEVRRTLRQIDRILLDVQDITGGVAGAHQILDGDIHTDSVNRTVDRGTLIYGNSSSPRKWDRLLRGTDTQFLGGDGTDVGWKDIDNFTADGSPVGSTDYLMSYDADAGIHKKVLMDDLSIGTMVEAAAVLGDNTLIRGDGGVRGVQDSGVTLSNADAMSGLSELDVSGNIIVSGTVDGVDVASHSDRHMTAGADVLSVLGFYNGTFLESFDAVVTSDGATVTLTVTNAVSGDLTMVFSDGETTFDLSGSDGIKTLTAGSDGSPTKNFVYILKSDKILTVSTSSWPTAEHIRIGFFYVPSAGFVQARGVYINHNMNDHSSDQSTDLGHLSHVTERIRAQSAIYKSGANLVIALSSGGTVVDISVSSSVVYQMHRHVSSALDTNTGDVVLVVNQNGSLFDDVTNLETLTNDSTGTPVKKYFNWVFWGTANKTGEFAPIMLNLPNGSYVRLDQATSDASGFDVLTMPAAFNGDSTTGFLIARVTMSLSGGVFVVESTTDLRGSTPQSVAGGGVGGQETQFADNQFLLFDESDATKELVFQLSGITTANTRTITMADQDIDLTPTTGTYPLSTAVLLKDGSVALTAAWAANDDITGLTKLEVDNLTLDGNEIAAAVDINLTLVATGTGDILIDVGAARVIRLSSIDVRFVGDLNADIVLTFDGTTNDGTLTYMEDEDEFRFGSPVLAATVAGGAAFGGDLILTSTSHPTKNDIFLGSGGSYVFDEANGRLGLGTAAPAVTLHLEEAGTVKVNTDFMQLVNNANAADMDGTATSILFRQAYLTGTVVDMGRLKFETFTDWTSTASTREGTFIVQITDNTGTIIDRLILYGHPNRTSIHNGRFQIQKDDDFCQLVIKTNRDSATDNSRISMRRSRGDIDNPTGLVDGDRVGQFEYRGHDGTSEQNRASVFVVVDGTVVDGSNAVPMEMQFRTGTTSSTDQRLVIDSSGDIFIKTGAARLYFSTFGEWITGAAGQLTYDATAGTGHRFNIQETAVLDIDTDEIRLYIGASQEGTISWDATDLYLENGITQKLRIGGSTHSLADSFLIGSLSAPATSAILELSSTTGALLLSRMTTAQRNALTAVNGMVVYNSTTNAFNFYENGAWVSGSGLA